MSEETIGDLPVTALDSGSAFVTSKAIEGAASAIERIGKPEKYSGAILFLRQLAALLQQLSRTLAHDEEQARKGAPKKLLVN